MADSTGAVVVSGPCSAGQSSHDREARRAILYRRLDTASDAVAAIILDELRALRREEDEERREQAGNVVDLAGRRAGR